MLPPAFARRTGRSSNIVALVWLGAMWLGVSCSSVPQDAGEETSAATDPCGIVTVPTTSYTYVEPRLASQSALDAAVGTSGGPVLLAVDSNNDIYLINEQNTTAHPHAQVAYKSVDQATSWQQQGIVSLAPGQCGSCLGITARPVGSGVQQRLVLGSLVCNGTSSTPCVGTTMISDDGGSSWSQAGNCTQPFATDYCSCSLAADDAGTMHLVYSVHGPSSPNALWQNSSGDGGTTWGQNGQIAIVSNLPRWPALATTGPTGTHQLVVVFEQEQANSAARWQMGAVTSTDNGKSWGAPEVVLAPSGDEMLSAPSFVALDEHTVAATYVHVVGDHNQETSRDVGIAFGQAQSGDVPVFGTRMSLGRCATFPASVVVLPPNRLLVATQTTSADGPFFTRLTLSR